MRKYSLDEHFTYARPSLKANSIFQYLVDACLEIVPWFGGRIPVETIKQHNDYQKVIADTLWICDYIRDLEQQSYKPVYHELCMEPMFLAPVIKHIEKYTQYFHPLMNFSYNLPNDLWNIGSWHLTEKNINEVVIARSITQKKTAVLHKLPINLQLKHRFAGLILTVYSHSPILIHGYATDQLTCIQPHASVKYQYGVIRGLY